MINNVKQKRNRTESKCAICEKIINKKVDRFGTGKKTWFTSKDGVFFCTCELNRTGRWFCNDCWKEMTK